MSVNVERDLLTANLESGRVALLHKQILARVDVLNTM